MGRLEPQVRVRREDGTLGTTCADFMSCCDYDETPVVPDGQGHFEGTKTASLVVLGPEDAKPHPDKCGAGRGAECCIFLTASTSGFQCDRFGNLRHNLILRAHKMKAQREPVEPYPACMKFDAATPEKGE